jgi:hypothetical protein
MTVAVAICLIAGLLAVVAAPAGAGPRWSRVPSPFPGSYDAYLNGVSCPSATDCIAVGWAYPPNGAIIRALVERWDGHAWTLMTSPKPTGSPGDADLNGVACPSTTSCFAVGYFQSGFAPNAFKTLVEH